MTRAEGLDVFQVKGIEISNSQKKVREIRACLEMNETDDFVIVQPQSLFDRQCAFEGD